LASLVTFARVEKLWPGETFVCIASGPSLTRADCDFVRGKARVIVINNSYQLATWADVLYACDWRWWMWHKGAPGFEGLKYSLQRKASEWGAQVLKRGPAPGLSDDPRTLNLGANSGYQAVNLAVHLGAARIILLGYDMQPSATGELHWHKDHPIRTENLYRTFRKHFLTLVEPLQARGITVVNCTRRTALEAFPCQPLETVFTTREVAA
jgi:hypothetical protein